MTDNNRGGVAGGLPNRRRLFIYTRSPSLLLNRDRFYVIFNTATVNKRGQAEWSLAGCLFANRGEGKSLKFKSKRSLERV